MYSWSYRLLYFFSLFYHDLFRVNPYCFFIEDDHKLNLGEKKKKVIFFWLTAELLELAAESYFFFLLSFFDLNQFLQP